MKNFTALYYAVLNKDGQESDIYIKKFFLVSSMPLDQNLANMIFGNDCLIIYHTLNAK